MSYLARDERAALSDTLVNVGPDAPTLCDGWRTRDLAAHLVVREGRLDAAAGMTIPPLAGHLASVMATYAAKPYEDLVSSFRSGPPLLSPYRLPKVDKLANAAEYFVHHEDVLRAADPAARRDLADSTQQQLWKALPASSRFALRESRVGVVADSPGVGRTTLRPAKDDHGSVVITGAPGEILLFCYGRGAVADVELDGADRDVAALRDTALGI